MSVSRNDIWIWSALQNAKIQYLVFQNGQTSDCLEEAFFHPCYKTYKNNQNYDSNSITFEHFNMLTCGIYGTISQFLSDNFSYIFCLQYKTVFILYHHIIRSYKQS